MEKITQYKAKDGVTFDTEIRALEYENEADLIEAITKSCLKAIPDDCNWEGYVTQNKSAVHDFKRVLMKIAKKHCHGNAAGVECIWDLPVEEVHAMGIAGRFIDDGGSNPLRLAWGRLCCMRQVDGGDYREYNQPFYAMNPDKTKDVERGV